MAKRARVKYFVWNPQERQAFRCKATPEMREAAQIMLRSLERLYGVNRKNVVMELYFDSPRATAPYHMVAWEHMPDGSTRKFYLM